MRCRCRGSSDRSPLRRTSAAGGGGGAQDVGVFEQQMRGNYLGAVHIAKAVAPGQRSARRCSAAFWPLLDRCSIAVWPLLGRCLAAA